MSPAACWSNGFQRNVSVDNKGAGGGGSEGGKQCGNFRALRITNQTAASHKKH